MVNRYSIDDTRTYEEEAFMRVNTLSVSDKKQRTIAKSLDRRFLDSKVFKSITDSNSVINEVYLSMDLHQLRSFSYDDELFDSYMRSNSSFLGTDCLNIFFINLKVGMTNGVLNKISDDDITFLNHILTWGKNDLYLMPILELGDDIDRHNAISIYSDFVKRMLESKNSMVPGNLNVGVSVPKFYRFKQVPCLLETYSEENVQPTFVSVDFDRHGFESSKHMGVVNTLNSYFKNEKIRDYFLYGFNVRNYKKKTENPVSDEMIIARSGFNAVGAPHYNPVKRKIPPTTQISQLGSVFSREDYRFHLLTDAEQRERFEEWSAQLQYPVDFESNIQKEAPKIRPVIKKYNLCMENQEFFDISDAIRKNDSDQLKDKLNRGKQ